MAEDPVSAPTSITNWVSAALQVVLKYGVGAAIALYLVYQMTGQLTTKVSALSEDHKTMSADVQVIKLRADEDLEYHKASLIMLRTLCYSMSKMAKTDPEKCNQ